MIIEINDDIKYDVNNETITLTYYFEKLTRPQTFWSPEEWDYEEYEFEITLDELIKYFASPDPLEFIYDKLGEEEFEKLSDDEIEKLMKENAVEMLKDRGQYLYEWLKEAAYKDWGGE